LNDEISKIMPQIKPRPMKDVSIPEATFVQVADNPDIDLEYLRKTFGGFFRNDPAMYVKTKPGRKRNRHEMESLTVESNTVT